MARKSVKSRSESSSRTISLPPELEEVSFAWRVKESDLNVSKLLETFKKFKAFTVADGRIRGALTSDTQYPSSHAHLFISHDSEESIYEFRFELVPESNVPEEKGAPTVSWFLDHISDYVVKSEKRFVGLLTMTFRFDNRTWEPSIPLPFTPPAGLDLPGVPQIAGVDLSFPNPSPEQPYIRAFVSTYPPLEHFTVRLMLGCQLKVASELGAKMIDNAMERVAGFARRRTEVTNA